MEGITSLKGDLRLKKFGLSDDAFSALCDEVDLVVHCGAQVNHFASYADHYDVNVGSLQYILQITKHVKPILYISTLAVVLAETGSDNTRLFANGYSTSKWVAEKLLHYYCGNSLIVVRPSYLGPSRDGLFNQKGYFAKLVRICISCGVVPLISEEKATFFHMTAVDDLATSTSALLMTDTSLGKDFNGLKKNISDRQLFAFVKKYVKGKNGKLEHLPFSEWVEAVRKTTKDVSVLPFLDRWASESSVMPRAGLNLDKVDFKSWETSVEVLKTVNSWCCLSSASFHVFADRLMAK